MWCGSCTVWSDWPICLYWQQNRDGDSVSRAAPVRHEAFLGSLLYSAMVFRYLLGFGLSAITHVQTTAEIIWAPQHIVEDYCTLSLGNYTKIPSWSGCTCNINVCVVDETRGLAKSLRATRFSLSDSRSLDHAGESTGPVAFVGFDFLHQKEMETQIAASSSPCIVDVVQSLALKNKFC